MLASLTARRVRPTICTKSKLKADEVLQQTKQTITFLPKINKVFLSPILQNLNGRSVLDKFLFENDPCDEQK